MGKKNCGTDAILKEAITNFYNDINDRAQKIENFAAAGDYKNYTVLVHSLKSSARLIGAGKLSEDAQYLEQCADNQNISEITEKTPALLELYKSYVEKLKPLCQTETVNSKDEISDEDFSNAIQSLKEVIQVFDFNTADIIIKEVEAYSIPERYKEKWSQIKNAVKQVDQNMAFKILSEVNV